MCGDFLINILTKFSLSAGEINIRFDFPNLISILSNEQAGDDKGLRVLLISLMSCSEIVCLKGPQYTFNSFSIISQPVPNQIHPANRMMRIMMTKGTVAFWRIAGIVAKTRIPHINKPNPKSRFEGKYIDLNPLIT